MFSTDYAEYDISLMISSKLEELMRAEYVYPILFVTIVLYVVPIVALLLLRSIPTQRNIQSKKLAESILRSNHSQATVQPSSMISSVLRSGYDIGNRVVLLSSRNSDSSDITAVAIAAHECCHAIQADKHYTPIIKYEQSSKRSVICMIVAAISLLLELAVSSGVWRIIFILIGYSAILLGMYYRLIILVAELDASKRAYKIMKRSGVLTSSELRYVGLTYVLMSLTYIASLLATYSVTFIVVHIIVIKIIQGMNRRRQPQ